MQDREKWNERSSSPPTQRMTTLDGQPVLEELVLVGWIDAERHQAESLRAYGVCLEHAVWDPETERWERCLFSVAALETLLELYDTGDFPYLLEASLSLAEAEWRLAEAKGLLERPAVPRWRYLAPAPPELLAKVGHLEEPSSKGPKLQLVKGGLED